MEGFRRIAASARRLPKELAIGDVAHVIELTPSRDERMLGASIAVAVLGKTLEDVGTIVGFIPPGSESIFAFALTLPHLLFWRLRPLPTGETAGALVRSYRVVKTWVSSLLGCCVSLGHALLVGVGSAVAGLQSGGGCGVPAWGASGAWPPRTLAVGVPLPIATDHALPADSGNVVV